MDLATWMSDELGDMRSRLESSVLGVIPVERHKERVDNGGSTVTSLLWHLARHQDVAVNTVVRGESQILDGFASDIGSGHLTAGEGLAEAESQAVTAALDPASVVAYYDAVCAYTQQWLPTISDSMLDAVPDSTTALTQSGVAEADYPWLYRMWEGKNVAFHIRWEAISHGVTHTGEMVSMRNRMGLSPF